MNGAMNLPPIVTESLFQEMDGCHDEESINCKFSGVVDALHHYMNHGSCLSGIQETRRTWTRPRQTAAFGNFVADPEFQYWYSYHHGGRNEAQFNLGLCPHHFRFGLGFEFSLKKGGDPTCIHFVYACFMNLVNKRSEWFEEFVIRNHLEVEWMDIQGRQGIVAPSDVLLWLQQPPSEPEWIFVGRLLKRDQPEDMDVLADPHSFSRSMEDVFAGFLEMWASSQQKANQLK